MHEACKADVIRRKKKTVFFLWFKYVDVVNNIIDNELNGYHNLLFTSKMTFLWKFWIQQQNWITDPFTTDLPTGLTISDQEQLIKLSSDSVTKFKFESSSLSEWFWIAVKKRYPIVANMDNIGLRFVCFFLLMWNGFFCLGSYYN